MQDSGSDKLDKKEGELMLVEVGSHSVPVTHCGIVIPRDKMLTPCYGRLDVRFT